MKKATHILTGEHVAIKILEKDRIIDVADVERVSREIHILKLIRHPNVIQLYEVVYGFNFPLNLNKKIDYRDTKTAVFGDGVC